MIAFGPVPSRRLGHSIGINNIPPKICSYSCVYCQVGKTLDMQVHRESFYRPDSIVKSVKNKIIESQKRGECIDYLTFVPDGEPTLDSNIGKEIQLLKSLHIKIAFITNATLLQRKDVRGDLLHADWISVKIDTVNPDIWKKVNRPHKKLQLDEILENIHTFSNIFGGIFTTETMLINDLNDHANELEKTACFISGLKPHISYLSIPTRPTAEKRIKSAAEYNVNMAYQIFEKQGINVEYLIGYEGNEFAFTGNIEEDILSIASVHPIREEGIKEMLNKAGADWPQITKLINEDNLTEIEYNGKKFYMRNFNNC
ncbi:radical SAM protein [Candidatus Latescibacterota bacterium]